MIALGASIFLFGCVVALVNHPRPLPPTLLTPSLPASASVIFIIHVVILNFFIGALNEPHWLRVWIFREKETKLQARSLGMTVVLSLVIIAIGLVGSMITKPANGILDLPALMNVVRERSYLYPVAFWIAAMAALFSSADSQIYSWLVVKQFDPKSGRLRERKMETIKPFATSATVRPS